MSSALSEVNRPDTTPATADSDSDIRLIVHYKASQQNAVQARAEFVDPTVSLARRTGFSMRRVHRVSESMHVVRIVGAGRIQAIARLRADPEVVSVEVDKRVYRHAVLPNDPLFSDQVFNSPQPVGQWHLKAPSGDVRSAINAVNAWSRTRGASRIVVAILDTGVRYDHPDLLSVSGGGRLLPGYDFVSEDSDGSLATANDADGRDPDASDPGDWVDSDLKSRFPALSSCSMANSSWHGTRVAGIIGALTDNGVGVAGIDWAARLLPVRVIGRCNGRMSDILAGMRWAAGLSVPGIPRNPNPARIINVSLGSADICSYSEQQVIDELLAAGVLVVASAGNDRGAVSSPGNCRGVLAVGGLRHFGTKVGYSNFGPEVGISAPAGNCVTTGAGDPCQYSIDTTTNAGTKEPGASAYTTQLNANVGTSFASPMVAGVAALLLSIDDTLTPTQLVSTLQRSASPFPSDPSLAACPTLAPANTSADGQCNCSTLYCGAGMLNAAAAIQLVNNVPSVPKGLVLTAESSEAIRLTWQASVDVVGVAFYRIYRDGNAIAPSVASTEYRDSGLQPASSYRYTVAACNAAERCSEASVAATGKTLASDSDRLMNWAEWKYPELFSPPGLTISISGFLARAYRNGIWLGTSGGRVYVLGPPWGDLPLEIGPVERFLPSVITDGF